MSNSDLEKTGHGVHDDQHLEKSLTAEANDARINQFTAAEQKRIIRRIDIRLVLTLGILYCTSLMDRTNLSSAAIAGSVNILTLRMEPLFRLS
jgi:hypothetical protein